MTAFDKFASAPSAPLGGRFLVVDDDAVARFIFSHWAAHWDLEGFYAADARVALGNPWHMRVNLAVIDYHLPDLNGLALIEELRNAARAAGHAPPRFALHSTDLDMREPARLAGVDFFLPKPLRTSDLYFALQCAGCRPEASPREAGDLSRFERQRIALTAAAF
ncbi:MAG: response regulator [Opitutales bacterium]